MKEDNKKVKALVLTSFFVLIENEIEGMKSFEKKEKLKFKMKKKIKQIY